MNLNPFFKNPTFILESALDSIKKKEASRELQQSTFAPFEAAKRAVQETASLLNERRAYVPQYEMGPAPQPSALDMARSHTYEGPESTGSGFGNMLSSVFAPAGKVASGFGQLASNVGTGLRDFNTAVETRGREQMFDRGGMSFWDQIVGGGRERLYNITGRDIGDSTAAQVVDATLSPASLIPVARGAEIANTLRAGGGAFNRIGAALVEPVVGGNVVRRLGGELGINAGSIFGGQAADTLPESTPFRDQILMAGSLLGGVAGARGAGLSWPGAKPTVAPARAADDIDPVARDILGWGDDAAEPALRSTDAVLGQRTRDQELIYQEYSDRNLRDRIEMQRSLLDGEVGDPRIIANRQRTLRNMENELARRESLVPRTEPEVDALRPEISGGASGQLLDPSPMRAGLNPLERAQAAIGTVFRIAQGQGLKPDQISQPAIRKFQQSINTLRNQSRITGQAMAAAEKYFKVKDGIAWPMGVHLHDIAFNLSKYKANMSPEQLRVIESLRTEMKNWLDAQDDAGIAYKLPQTKDPEGFWIPSGKGVTVDGKEIKRVAGNATNLMTKKGYKFSSSTDALAEWTNGVGISIAEKGLLDDIKGVKAALPKSPAGKGKVSISGEQITLPKPVSDNIRHELNKYRSRGSRDDIVILADLANTVGKTVRASADIGSFGINGVITLFEAPHRLARAGWIGFRNAFDPSTMYEYYRTKDLEAVKKGLPTTKDWARYDLHQAGANATGLDVAGGVAHIISRVPVIKQSTDFYSGMTDALRREMADNYYDIVNNPGLKTSIRSHEGEAHQPENMRAIASAANRASGYTTANISPGGLADFALFAPRFLASQLEIIAKGANVKGGLDSELARRQITRTVGVGIMLTLAGNGDLKRIAEGDYDNLETEFNPQNSNFMMIRNVPGVGDVTVFGPYHSLIRGIAMTPDEPLYLLRTKSSPLVGTIWDALTGKDVFGNEAYRTPRQIFTAQLPFNVRDIVEGEPTGTAAVSSLGFKANPLSGSEELELKLKDAGITEDDPDYLIKRRDYLRDNPDDIPEAFSDESKRAREVKDEVESRELANEQQTLDNTQPLSDFRENRKLLKKEQRDRIGEIIDDFDSDANTPQEKWLESYYDLFNEDKHKGVLDEVTKGINPDVFDPLEAEWIAKNGPDAYSFIQRYTLSGTTEVEQAYLRDMQTLANSGYWDMQKYENLKSDLPEEELDNLRSRVVSARKAGGLPESFSASTAIVLKGMGITDKDIIADVANLGKKAYQSDEYQALKQLHGRELMWFSGDAYWADYNNYDPDAQDDDSSGGGLSYGYNPGGSRTGSRSSLGSRKLKSGSLR